MKRIHYLISLLALVILFIAGNPAKATMITGHPVQLYMQYIGGDPSDIISAQDPTKYEISGNAVSFGEVFIEAYDSGVYFADAVALNDYFLIDATVIAGRTELTSRTYIDIYDSSKNNLLQEIYFHTSGSQPISVGDQYGALTVAGFVDENGFGTSPPLPEPVPEPTTMLLFGTGIASLAAVRRKRK